MREAKDRSRLAERLCAEKGAPRTVISFVLEIAAAAVVVFLVNLVPALMPPTWAVLTFFHLATGAPVLPLAISGAVAAASGRGALALVSRRYGIRLVPAARRAGLLRFGAWLDVRSRWAAPLAMLFYSFGPIPSNQLFIAAGLARLRLMPIVLAFLAGRLVSYPLWIGVAHVAAARLDELFLSRLTSVPALAIEVASLALLVAFTRIDWIRLIARYEPGTV